MALRYVILIHRGNAIKMQIRRKTGFIIAKVLENPDGVTIITAGKGD